MAVRLNHTIVESRDKATSAEFLARILGLGPPIPFGHFLTVEVANGVPLSFFVARAGDAPVTRLLSGSPKRSDPPSSATAGGRLTR